MLKFKASINSLDENILSRVLRLVVERAVFAIIRTNCFNERIEWLYLKRYLQTIFKNGLINAGWKLICKAISYVSINYKFIAYSREVKWGATVLVFGSAFNTLFLISFFIYFSSTSPNKCFVPDFNIINPHLHYVI